MPVCVDPAAGPVHLVVMGVSGSGKTTVAQALVERLGWPLGEADDFHPPANVAKMAAGVPLTDEDRWPWLRAIRDWMTEHARAGRSTVVTCSALRRVYRDVLREASGQVVFVHLAADEPVLRERLTHRAGHFMPASLLPSQLATLEPLGPHESGVVLDAAAPPDDLVDQILEVLRER
jgi:gluconokinase